MTAIRQLHELRAAVVGTGFVGTVHIDAIRRLGVQLVGVAGLPQDTAAAAAFAPAYPSFEAAIADPQVDVVHIATPNHLHFPQALAALEAGKHVVCEKPLTITAEQSAQLVAAAQRSGRVNCTNFNLRFYPMVQEARARVASGSLGDLWNIHGGYLQDWLALPEDWNWRLEGDKGGSLRAVADIGSHWLDMAQFLAGQRIVEVFADLATAIPVRRRPAGEVQTFTSAGEVERIDAPMTTEDIGHILVRFESGARGSCVVSQVSFGRKNALRIEVDGSRGALHWDGERNEELWLGHRDRANELLQRNPALLSPAAAATTRLPAAHGEGYADTFRELYRAVYAEVAQGGPSAQPAYPTFLDGHVANVLCEAIAQSSRERRWVAV